MSDIHNGDDEETHTLQAENKLHIIDGLDKGIRLKPVDVNRCAVRRQALMVTLGNIGVLASGIGLGLPTVVMDQLTNPEEAVHLSATQASWFASFNALSSPLGGLLSGYILDKCGRKRTLYVMNLLSLVAWLLMALAVQENVEAVYIQLMVSRFIIGITTGLSSAPVGVYSAEISTPSMRGRLILGTSISIATGITLIYILGFFIRNDWQLIAMIVCGYQLISLVCVVPMPESPSWLISKGRIAEAKSSLNYFRGMKKSAILTNPEVVAEFNILQKSIQMVAVIVYAVQMSTEAHIAIDPFMCAVLIGLARLVTTCPMGAILEKWGRRRSGIISTLGMCVCMLLLAANSWSQSLQQVPYLALVSIVAFIVLSTLGLYTLPFFMLSELFPQKVRGPASGLTVAFGMFFAFVCLKTYPSLRMKIGNEYCFVIFAVAAFIATIYIYLLLPETRGRTLLEIEEYFRSKRSPRIYHSRRARVQH